MKEYIQKITAKQKLKELAESEYFVVFYDPDNPENSALTRASLTNKPLLLFLVSGLLTIIPVLTWVREDKNIIDPKNY